MLEDFLMQQMEGPLVGFDDHRQMLMGDVMLSFEADGTTTNYMGWWKRDRKSLSSHIQH